MAREVYVIGDASRPRNGLFALREGAEVGRRICPVPGKGEDLALG